MSVVSFGYDANKQYAIVGRKAIDFQNDTRYKKRADLYGNTPF